MLSFFSIWESERCPSIAERPVTVKQRQLIWELTSDILVSPTTGRGQFIYVNADPTGVSRYYGDRLMTSATCFSHWQLEKINSLNASPTADGGRRHVGVHSNAMLTLAVGIRLRRILPPPLIIEWFARRARLERAIAEREIGNWIF